LVTDGISSDNYNETKNSLNQLARYGGILTSSETLAFQLLRDKNSPKFKDISLLVQEYSKHPLNNALMCYHNKI
jgi:hypothetical protein